MSEFSSQIRMIDKDSNDLRSVVRFDPETRVINWVGVDGKLLSETLEELSAAVVNESAQERYSYLVPVCLCIVATLPESLVRVRANALHLLSKLLRYEILRKDTANLNNLDQCNDYLSDVVEAVKACALEDEDATYFGCVILMVLASDSEYRQSKFVDANGTEVIVEVLRRYKTHSKIVEMACRVIRNFSTDDNVAAQLVQDGVGENLSEVLSSHLSDPIVVEAVMWAVVNLSYDSDIAVILGSLGLCLGVIDALRSTRHLPPETSLSLDNSICWAIRNLLCPTQNYSTFAKSDAAELLVVTLPRHPEDPEFLSSAVWALINLAGTREMSEKMFSLKVPEVILEICRQCVQTIPEDRQLGPIAEATIYAVRGLAVHATVEQKSLMSDLGAVELIAVFMVRYLDREGMVEGACYTLSILARNVPAIQRRVVTIGAVEAALDAAERHVQVPETVVACLKLLIILTEDGSEECIERIRSCRGVARTVSLLRTHQSLNDLMAICCQLLLQVHFVDESSCERLKAAGHVARTDEIADAEVQDGNTENRKVCASSSEEYSRLIVVQPLGTTFESINEVWRVEDISEASEK